MNQDLYQCALHFDGDPKKSSSEIDEDTMKKYVDSYDSIIKQNKGAGRFKNYDLFSCFKTDKEATVKFIEDFMTLNLMNDENCSIDNNTVLTLFNIFDSHIYLTLMYNLMPTKQGTVDEFIKIQVSFCHCFFHPFYSESDSSV